MRSNKRNWLWPFALAPITAHASGDYVLPALMIDVFVFIAIMVIIFNAWLRWPGKLILVVVYLMAMWILFYGIDQVNYLNNLTLINLSCLLLPPAVVFLTYLVIRNKFRKPRALNN